MDAAIFAKTEAGKCFRVSPWMTTRKAQDRYAKLLDPFQPGGEPCEVGFWEDSDHRGVVGREPVMHLAVRSRLELRDAGTRLLVRGEALLAAPSNYVSLDRGDRSALLSLARRAGSLEDGMDAACTALLDRTDTEHLDAATVSDYAWSLARFAFPAEARYV